MKTEYDVDLILDLLRGSPTFSRLDADELKKLSDYCEISSVRKGEVIFNPGDLGSCLYLIAKGSVVIHNSVISSDNSGDRVIMTPLDDIVARFKAGESFGELEFFNASERSAFAIAETDTTIVRYPGQGNSLNELLDGEPELTAHLMHYFLNSVADRIRIANSLIRENSVWVRELRNQMYTDKLTGLYNRTYLEENFERYHRDSGIGLLMIKPDNFKVINDTFGHDAGDTAIKVIAKTIQAGCEEGEVSVRFMGNEFAVILPMTDREGIEERAEFFQDLVCGLDFADTVGDLPVPLTASIGVWILREQRTQAAVTTDDNGVGDHTTEYFLTAIEATHEMAMKGRTIGGRKILYAN